MRQDPLSNEILDARVVVIDGDNNRIGYELDGKVEYLDVNWPEEFRLDHTIRTCLLVSALRMQALPFASWP